ncbi:4Fe-4S binding protein [Gordonia sp. TBRC 11910]|uniref:ferredoxin--NADP(+) reductase n=1 Tax=Gordonia asplenii TaxID=2725283 RepID=A0A848KYU5_9ACTN|nr:4Fe-4S binding protein [Gordonia asplenii]NMO00608.1 4Fe-4S binding protein [Gordonia asplenii]
MPHVVTQACCGDASCVYACPVNCIHPTPDEPDFGTAEMLYIDPSTCVDCGACVSACPVGAIKPGHRLPDDQQRFLDINAGQYGDSVGDVRFPVDQKFRLPMAPMGHPEPLRLSGNKPVSVAIVGSGPSAMYAADELLRYPRVEVTMYERLSTPFGLARFGVAPDHLETRSVIRLYDTVARDPRLTILVNTEVGRDLTLDELDARHDAVIWAGGAPTDRRLDIPGVDAPGCASATSFVGWYNGHPDFADLDFDLSGERVVIVGNGNVALDVARILTADPDSLASTTISRRALAKLRESQVTEVLVVGRRGPDVAAFTLPELVGLADGHANVAVDPLELSAMPNLAAAQGRPGDHVAAEKVALLREIAERAPRPGKVIRLAFRRSPEEILVGADGSVNGIRFGINEIDAAGSAVATGTSVDVEAGLVLTSIGYRGVAVPGLPFDDTRGVIPNDRGRVLDGSTPIRGRYVTGWIKRGPSGFIGTNKTDSTETVGMLREDLEAGALARV